MYTANSIVDHLENLVESGFSAAGIPCSRVFAPGHTVLFGVSGGADSMALLSASVRIRQKKFPAGGARFVVISVDHNLRPPEESAGDTRFVETFCSTLQNVVCRIVRFVPGEIKQTAALRKKGLEEAARFLRYQAFSLEFHREKGEAFCLAHTRNDQLETLLLRFFQGGTGSAAAGIRRHRDFYYRPLLNVSRSEIESYLDVLQISYRTDSSNFDNRYLRNRIRNRLVPLLNELLPGWDTAVCAGAERQVEDSDCIENLITASPAWQPLSETAARGVYMDVKKFFAGHPAVRRRLLYQAFTMLGVTSRVPSLFLKRIIYSAIPCGTDKRAFTAGGVQITLSARQIIVAICTGIASVEGFYGVIDAPGMYQFPFGTILVETVTGSAVGFGPFQLPLIIRSIQPGDRFTDRQGRQKDLPVIMKELSVPELSRSLLPVVESCTTGSLYIIPFLMQHADGPWLTVGEQQQNGEDVLGDGQVFIKIVSGDV